MIRDWTTDGMDLTGSHLRQRLEERGIPEAALAIIDPDDWEIVSVDVSRSTRRITAIGIRRELATDLWLWAILVHEHVVTAWLRENSGTSPRAASVTRSGPIWQGVREQYDARRARHLQSAPRQPPGGGLDSPRLLRIEEALATTTMSVFLRRRLHDACALVRSGLSWRQAFEAAGWTSVETAQTSIKRLLRDARSRLPIPVMPYDRWEQALARIEDLESRLPHASVRATTTERLGRAFALVRSGHRWSSAAALAGFPSSSAMASAMRRVAAAPVILERPLQPESAARAGRRTRTAV